MQTVWRVQNSSGVGPYHGLGADNWTERRHDILSGHPCPYEDLGIAPFWRSLGIELRNWKFGFTTEEQLKQWFNKEELENLAASGFHVVQVPAIEVKMGTHQVVFLPLAPEPEVTVSEEVDCEYKVVPI